MNSYEIMKDNEKDLELKLRVMRFLWYNGHFTRRNIDLFRYAYGERTSQQYTDIDVFGLKVNEKFKFSKTVCDCKSGHHAKVKDRIFSLSGIMNYTGSNQGIFIRTKMDESQFFNLAKKLKITPLSSSRLDELESAYTIDSLPYVGAFNKDLVYSESEIFKKLKGSARKVHDYIKYKYWSDPIQKQVNALIEAQFKIDALDSINEIEKAFLQIYTLTLFSISILGFSETILIFPHRERKQHILNSLLGGEKETTERKKLFEGFYTFMAEEIKRRYDRVYPLTKEEFLEYLEPSYSKYIVDIIERMCLDPVNAVQVPRFLDIIAYEFILNDNTENTEDMLFSHNNNFDLPSVVKLTKDFLVFSKRVGFMNEERFTELNSIVSGI